MAAKKAKPRAAAAKAAGAPLSAAAALAEAADLLYRQAEALDAKDWQGFIDLFAPDGVYWVPADPAHEHWDGVPSIFCEDRDMMTVRHGQAALYMGRPAQAAAGRRSDTIA